MRETVRDKHYFHSCGKCGFIWSHDPPGDSTTSAEFRDMHSCSQCGSQENCDIALKDESEAAEFATHARVTMPDGDVYHAPSRATRAMGRLFGYI